MICILQNIITFKITITGCNIFLFKYYLIVNQGYLRNSIDLKQTINIIRYFYALSFCNEIRGKIFSFTTIIFFAKLNIELSIKYKILFFLEG